MRLLLKVTILFANTLFLQFFGSCSLVAEVYILKMHIWDIVGSNLRPTPDATAQLLTELS